MKLYYYVETDKIRGDVYRQAAQRLRSHGQNQAIAQSLEKWRSPLTNSLTVANVSNHQTQITFANNPSKLRRSGAATC